MLLLLLCGFFAANGCEGEEEQLLPKEPHSVILGEHPNQADCIFSPDGKTVASFGQGRSIKNKYGIPQPLGALKIWDVSLRKSRVLEWDVPIGFATYSPDGNLLAITTNEAGKEAFQIGDRVIILWNVKTGERVATLKWDRLAGIGRGIFSPDGKTLAAATSRAFDTRRCRVPLWDVPSGKLQCAIEVSKESFVYSLQFSPDGKTLAVGGLVSIPEGRVNIRDEPSLLQLWEVARGKVRLEFKDMKGPIYSVAFSPDGKLLAIGGNIGKEINEILIWDLMKKERHAVLTGHRGVVHQVAFSHDGKLLASAGGSEKDGELRLWDVRQLREVASLKGHTNAVTSISFSPDDNMLASGSRDSTVRLWYLRDPPPAKDKSDR